MVVVGVVAAAAALSAPLSFADPIQCTSAAERPNWPTYHFFNNISANLKMEALNDANAVFQYKGLYHVMLQAGGGNWTHGVSSDMVRWFTLPDALNRDSKIPWDSTSTSAALAH